MADGSLIPSEWAKVVKARTNSLARLNAAYIALAEWVRASTQKQSETQFTLQLEREQRQESQENAAEAEVEAMVVYVETLRAYRDILVELRQQVLLTSDPRSVPISHPIVSLASNAEMSSSESGPLSDGGSQGSERSESGKTQAPPAQNIEAAASGETRESAEAIETQFRLSIARMRLAIMRAIVEALRFDEQSLLLDSQVERELHSTKT